jgi:hypothetical protein
MAKQRKQHKRRNLDVVDMIIGRKGGPMKDKRLKRIKERLRKQLEE